MTFDERVAAIAKTGFTERQARFLTTIMLHSGVCVPRQYAWFCGIVDAFPDDAAPKSLHRDRDSVYGESFRPQVTGMGIAEVVSAPASPWQNPYAERVIGSIRRECLDHVIVLK